MKTIHVTALLVLLACPALADEAIEARSAIEAVYWHDRDWPADNPTPKPSFAEAIGEAALRADWHRTLKQRALLEEHWGVTIDGAALQRELERIVRTTRDPERLERLFAALDHDAERIANYLVQPILVERLLAARFERDPEIHRATRESIAPELRGELDGAGFVALAGKAVRLEWGRATTADRSDGMRLLHGDEAWDRLVDGLRSELKVDRLAVGQLSPLIEDAGAFRRFAVVEVEEDRIAIRSAHWPKTTLDRWIDRQAPASEVEGPVAPPTKKFS